MRDRLMNIIRMKRIELFEHGFRKLTLKDRKWVTDACKADSGVTADINFLTMFLMQEVYCFDLFKKEHGCVVKRPWEKEGKLYCRYPIGLPEKRKQNVKHIVEVYSALYKEFVSFGASEENVEELKELFGEKVVEAYSDRDAECYMLDAREQITLDGSQFSDRRNKIRRFGKLNNWTYEEVTKENLQDCLSINQLWYEAHKKDENVDLEQIQLKLMFNCWDYFNFQGGILRCDGKPVAFITGTPFNGEVYMCMIAKSCKEYRDASIVVMHEFVKRNCAQYSYINYSEDMGDPGLRKYKMMLRPKFLSPFYYVTVKL